MGGQRPAPAALPLGLENFAPRGARTPDPPARSEWLYWSTINEVPEFNPYTSIATWEGKCVTFVFGYITLLVLGTGEDEKIHFFFQIKNS